MQKILKYIRLWLILTKNSFMMVFVVRLSVVLFFLAKGIRFLLYFLFLRSLFAGFRTGSGYSGDALIFAFLTYIVIDTLVQLLFREVYRFRSLIVSGDFDLILTKPIRPLFRVLIGGADPIDLILLIPYCALLIQSMVRVSWNTPVSIAVYLLLLANSFLIATGFHIMVLALTVLTSEIDHTILIYRDLTGMGRIPVDLYREPLRTVITFVLPVGIMMTFPVRGFIGTLPLPMLVSALGIGIGFFLASLLLWKRTLLRYTSASS